MSTFKFKNFSIFLTVILFLFIGVNGVVAAEDSYAQQWEKAKKEFESMFGKKPAEKKKLFIIEYNAKSGLGQALRDIDDKSKKVNKKNPGKDALKEFREAIQKFKNKKQEYETLLDKSGKTDPGYNDMITFLKKKLEALETLAEKELSNIETKGDVIAKLNATAKPNLKKTLAEAEAFIAKVEANKKKKVEDAIKVYNEGISKAARGVNTAVHNSLTLDQTSKGAELDEALKQWGNNPVKPTKAADFQSLFDGFKDIISQTKDYFGSLP